MFNIRPKQPTDPLRFCFQSIKFMFFYSSRSSWPDILSILDHTASVPLGSAFPHAPFRFRQPPAVLCFCIQPFVIPIGISKFAVIRM